LIDSGKAAAITIDPANDRKKKTGPSKRGRSFFIEI